MSCEEKEKLEIEKDIPLPPSSMAGKPLCSHCHRRVCREGSALCSRCTGKEIIQDLRDTLPGLEVKDTWKAVRAPNSTYIYAGVQEGQRAATSTPEHIGTICTMPEHGKCIITTLGISSDEDIRLFGNGWHHRDCVYVPEEEDGKPVDSNLSVNSTATTAPKAEAVSAGRVVYRTRNETAALLGISATSICRWEQKGKTPRPVQFTRGGPLYYSEEHIQKMREHMSQTLVIHQQGTSENQQEKAAKVVAKKVFKVNKGLERAVAMRLGRSGLGGGKLL